MTKTNAAITDAASTIATFPCRVLNVTPVSANTFEIELQSPDDVILDYIAGHYLKLDLDVNKDGTPLSLFYSIANHCDPKSPRRLQLLLQKTSDFSGQVLKRLSEVSLNKEEVNITLPMGQSFLQTDLSAPHILIAAGSGIAKIKSLTEAILAKKPDAEVRLYWSNRNVEDFYFLEEFKSLTSQHKNLVFTPILESAADNWAERSGFIFEVIQEDFDTLETCYAYICGSPQMVYGTIDQLESRGLKEENCYSDAFEFAPRDAAK